MGENNQLARFCQRKTVVQLFDGPAGRGRHPVMTLAMAPHQWFLDTVVQLVLAIANMVTCREAKV